MNKKTHFAGQLNDQRALLIFTNLLTQDWHGAGFYARVGAQFIDEESKIPVRYRAATVG